MKLQYTLSFSDFLEYQLYFSSKSKVQQKNRKKSRIIVPIIYAVLILIAALIIGNYILAITFTIIAVIWYLFHPIYAKYRYKKHFDKHVKENYKNRINKDVTLIFNNTSNTIEGVEAGIQTIINYSEFDTLIEVKDHFFLKLKSEVSLVIPKHAVDNINAFKALFLDYNIKYLDDTTWEWK